MSASSSFISRPFPACVARRNSLRRALLLPLTLTALSLLGGCASSGQSLTYEDPQKAGERYFKQQNFAEAAGAFRNVVRDDPRDYNAYYYLGASYEQLNAYQEAITAYKTGLDVRPLTLAGRDDAQGHLKLLDGLARTVAKGDSRDAELDALQAKARRTQSPFDFFVLAKVSRYSSDADAALEQYNHAVLLDNHNFAILKEYGLYLQQLKQSSRARQVLWQAYAINQQDPQVAIALRDLGVVPGPSLKDKTELVQPVIPVGPIPPPAEIGRELGLMPGNPKRTENPQPAGSLQAPRD